MSENGGVNESGAMSRAVERLAQLPGLGRRSAERIVFHLLKAPASESRELAEALHELRRRLTPCSACFFVSESDPCPICADPQRDRSVILAAEEPRDVLSIESVGAYRGLYHVLMGRLSPLEGVSEGDLTIDELVRRVRASREPGAVPVREVIAATNPTFEGDGTALTLSQRLSDLDVKVSRLARGVPAGTELRRVSKGVLWDAIHGRQRLGPDD